MRDWEWEAYERNLKVYEFDLVDDKVNVIGSCSARSTSEAVESFSVELVDEFSENAEYSVLLHNEHDNQVEKVASVLSKNSRLIEYTIIEENPENVRFNGEM